MSKVDEAKKDLTTVLQKTVDMLTSSLAKIRSMNRTGPNGDSVL